MVDALVNSANSLTLTTFCRQHRGWKKNTINDKTPQNTNTGSEAVRASSRSCFPHTTWLVGLSIQDAFIDDVAYHSVDAMCLIP